jgi:hypothetical protein
MLVHCYSTVRVNDEDCPEWIHEYRDIIGFTDYEKKVDGRSI